ncbi:hypothetical protein [Paenibacillus sp. NPDC057967]|uniref:hypothetical protein n=1 Tax=Paenibacillus sp. NPDC057967 TaxID=3346293 RepID=UPI0036DD9E5D
MKEALDITNALRNNTDVPQDVSLTLNPGEEVRKSTAKQRESFREREEFTGRAPDFTFADISEIDSVIGALTTAQCGYLLVLQCYVGYDDGRLVDGNKRVLTTALMMDVLQLKRKRQTFYDFLTVSLDNGILTKNDDGSYCVNPRYHFRGATQNRAVIRSYTAKVRHLYREVNAADIGLMYRMLPYVHYGTNALCANPTETDPMKIRWLNGKELAEAIGVHEKSLSRSLPRMKFGGEYVIARLKFGASNEPVRYFFNPNVFYRKSKAPDDTLLAMFNVGYRTKR